MVEQKLLDVICIDSIASLFTRQESEQKIGEHKGGIAELPRAISRMVKKMYKWKDEGITILFTNQERSVIGEMYKKSNVTGGNALKYAKSVAIRVKQKGQSQHLKDTNGEIFQAATEFTITKTKVSKPFQIANSFLNVTDNDTKMCYDNFNNLFQQALYFDIIKKAGSWFVITNLDNEEIRVQGAAKIIKLLNDDLDFYTLLKTKIYSKFLAPYEFYFTFSEITKALANENNKLNQLRGNDVSGFDFKKFANITNFLSESEIKSAEKQLLKLDLGEAEMKKLKKQNFYKIKKEKVEEKNAVD